MSTAITKKNNTSRNESGLRTAETLMLKSVKKKVKRQNGYV